MIRGIRKARLAEEKMVREVVSRMLDAVVSQRMSNQCEITKGADITDSGDKE